MSGNFNRSLKSKNLENQKIEQIPKKELLLKRKEKAKIASVPVKLKREHKSKIFILKT